MAMAPQAPKLHFLMFPLMAQGHMISMMDIAKILLQHNDNVIVTVFTTPHNASRFAPTFSRFQDHHIRIRFIQLQLPYKDAGLPDGCDNLDMLPSLATAFTFLNAANSLHQQVENHLLSQDDGLMIAPPPSCIVSDMGLPYTLHIANKLGVPRISFVGMSCFCRFCVHNVQIFNIRESVSDETEYFVLPGIPDRVEVTRAQLPSSMAKGGENWSKFIDEMYAAEMASYGMIMNSFEELEPAYARGFKKVKNGKLWCIGPVSLTNKDQLDKAERGNKASNDDWQHLRWLDRQNPASVIYACFGSLSCLAAPQLIELGLALEASKRPFIWVIGGRNQLEALENWIKEDGFEERTTGRGIIIRGWAPQLLILSHPAIGGFMTHCGWNSTLEAICAGVPMITWPQFADQFLNERLVVEILKVGVEVGVERPITWGKEEEMGVLVKKEDVEGAIKKLMDETTEREGRRKRIQELAKKAKIAVEQGGSSYSNVTLLIQDIMQKTKGEI